MRDCRFITTTDPAYPSGALHIFAENKPAETHNVHMLTCNNNMLFSLSAKDEIPKNVQQSLITKTMNQNQSQTGGLAETLQLKVNARVMLTVNIDVSDRLINCQIGTVCNIFFGCTNEVIKIYVKFDDENAGKKIMKSDTLAIQHNWVPIERVESSIRIKSYQISSPVIKRTQFPLMLAWACTVHKVQGLSLKQAVISFDILRQRSFNNGQMYVALRRVTSLEGLFLTGKYNLSAIKADPRSKLEYERMHLESNIKPLATCGNMSNSSIIISLLNTRSLNRYAVDISHDRQLLESDLICLTETHIKSTDKQENIIAGFKLFHNISSDKFQSLALCYQYNIDINDIFNIPGISLFTISKKNVPQTRLRMLLLYRKQTINIQTYCENLTNLLRLESIQNVLADFNINALNSNNPLVSVFADYTQIVSKPTHLSGSLLDHVYIKKTLLETVDIISFVKSIYFSEHDIIQFKLTF